MRARTILYVGNFFFSLFAALIGYILLPYLSGFMSVAYAGFVIAGGALAALIAFPFLPDLVERFGIRRMALVFALLIMLALFALAASPGPFTAVVLIALAVGLQPLLYYELDLLLEATVEQEGTTGRIRTLFITAWNFAALGAPLFIGAILADADAYGRIFLAAGAAMVPFVALFALRRLPEGEPPKLMRMKETFVCLAKNRDLAASTFGHFLLYAFFIWASFYTPAYLHTELGIPWSDLGWMFAIMLLPYAILEYPAGWLADRFFGDKEMMLAGFVIAGVSLVFISLLTSQTPLWLVLIVLVATRTGAALVESMTEGHFFRRVSERDVNSIGIFRAVWPLANLLAPIAGSIILVSFGSFETLFVITGAFVVLAGSLSTIFIEDYRPARNVAAGPVV